MVEYREVPGSGWVVTGCGGGGDQLANELVGAVQNAVRPVRAHGNRQSREAFLAHEDQIRKWVDWDLHRASIHGKLTRLGVVVPDRTLHRLAIDRCGFGQHAVTVRVADGEPGVECQIGFARIGLIFDPVAVVAD